MVRILAACLMKEGGKMRNYSIIKAIGIIISMALLVFLSLVGCDNNERTANTATGKSDGENELKGDLELQIFVGGYGDEFWKEAIEGFKKSNPKINVIVNMGPKVNEQMKTRWVSDNPPDFLYLDGPGIPTQQLENDGKFMDLKQWFYSTKTEDGNSLIKDRFIKGLLVEKNGKIYSAPYIFVTWGIWYDQKFFNDSNLLPPTNFDELLKVGNVLKTENVALIDYTGIYPIYIFRGMVLQALVSEGGQQLFDDVMALKPGVFESKAFKKIIKKIQILAEQELFLKGTVALNHIQSQMEWLNKKAALIPNGLWLESEMKKDIPVDFVMGYIPSVLQDAGQKYGVCTEAISMAISSKSKNPEAAKAFIAYLYKEEVVRRFVELTGTLSVYNIDTSHLNVSEATKSVQRWLGDQNIEFVYKKANLDASVEKVASDGLNSLVLGKIKVDEYCKRVQEEADRVISERTKLQLE